MSFEAETDTGVPKLGRRAANKINYTIVNKSWPKEVPPMTESEVIAVTKRLWRIGTKKAWKHSRWKIKFTSGNRYTELRWENHQRVLFVNLSRDGWIHQTTWSQLVHAISHGIRNSHGARHADLEQTLIEHVVKSGWLDGRFQKPEKPKPTSADRKNKKLVSARNRLAAWETKAKRAKTAIKKITQQIKRWEKAMQPTTEESSS